jgi:methionyl aminopeptidase
MMDTDRIIIKTPEQIAGIREACHLARRCLETIQPFVVEGVTTKELDDRIDAFIKDQYGESACRGYNGFPAATCISVNEVICHGVPNERVLQNGDILNIDVTTIVKGYYGDTSKMFVVGEIDADSKKLIDVARTCLDIGIKQVKPDNYTGNIGYWVDDYARRNGFQTVKQLCGHGVGCFFHEPPDIPFFGKRYTGVQLKPGMIITIEPMINAGTWEGVVDESDGWTIRTKDNKRSAQFEHTVLVTANGHEVLT